MYKFSKYILLQNHWIYPLCAKGLPRSEICNSDARCRKTWTHALAVLERSRISIDQLCLYLLTNNMLEAVYMLLIYISVSFHLDSASPSNPKPTQPSFQPATKNQLTITPPLSIWASPCLTVSVPTLGAPLPFPFPLVPVIVVLCIVNVCIKIRNGARSVSRRDVAVPSSRVRRTVFSERPAHETEEMASFA